MVQSNPAAARGRTPSVVGLGSKDAPWLPYGRQILPSALCTEWTRTICSHSHLIGQLDRRTQYQTRQGTNGQEVPHRPAVRSCGYGV